ncbi:MAG TPA: transcription termination factor NusA [Gemmatimonadota bacterium]|nr:transcription termination factor NusA [Gemmatimonadota bacterium]
MATEILDAFSQLTREKALDRTEVVDLVKAGMLAAVRRKYGAEANADIVIDPTTGKIGIYLLKEVVADEEALEDPSRQMTVAEAKDLPYVNEPWGDGDPQPGQVAEIPLEVSDFGRNAIQAAKQMIIQKVREEERNRIRAEYADKVGQLVSGTVQQVDRGNALVFLDRRTEALLPAREQVRREYLRQGETIRALLLDIRETNKGPQLVLSRTHPDFVKALFALEVPEVFQGIVEIRAIAREPGSRSKIAVWSRDQHVDPVGACVGLKGSRVQAVVSELGGERIDIVPWTDEPREFIAQALSPAQVYKITLQEPGGTDDGGLFAESLSGAIKSRARFRGPTAAPAPFQPASPEETAAALEAAKVSREEAARRASQGPAAEEPGEEAPESAAAPEAVIRPEPPEKRATVVCAEDQLSLAIGRSGQNVRLASKLTGYRIDLVSKADYLAQEEALLFGRRPEPVEAAPAVEEDEEFALADIPGIDAETAAALAAGGYRTFDDIINLEHDELSAIPGIGPETATKLVQLIDEMTVEVDEEWEDETEAEAPAPPAAAAEPAEEPAAAEPAEEPDAPAASAEEPDAPAASAEEPSAGESEDEPETPR